MTALDEPVTPPAPAEPAPVPAVGEKATTNLMADIADDAGTLFGQHASLLQAEVRDGLRLAQWWVVGLGVGVVCAAVGIVFTAVAGVDALGECVPALPRWACWLIVGGTLLVGGGTLAAVGGRQLGRFSYVPTRTLKSLSETWSWLVKRSK